MNKVHRIPPTRRTPFPSDRPYNKFRQELSVDFNECCGYCGSPHKYFGGIMGSHIDHFAPQRQFANLTNKYKNLVYSCPLCNRKKGSKWVMPSCTPSHNGVQGFVDPCSPDYSKHVARDSKGFIIGMDALGKYIVEELGLNVLRHKLIWEAGKLMLAKKELLKLASKHPNLMTLVLALTHVIDEIEQRIHRQ